MAISADNKKSTKKCDFMEKVYKYLNGDQKVEIADAFLTKNMIDVFKDVELRQSIDSFFAKRLVRILVRLIHQNGEWRQLLLHQRTENVATTNMISVNSRWHIAICSGSLRYTSP